MAETYTVQKGDTLNAIASRYGFKNYKEAGISGYRSGNADLIYAGEKLTIGNYKAPATSPTSGRATSNTAADIINSGQDADIASAPDPDEPPSRNSKSRSSRYSAAFSDIGELFGTAEDRPEAPSFEKLYNSLRKKYDVASLEDYVNDLQTEEDEIFATLRQRRTAERGKTVAMNVIEGRISETERQEAERIDYIRRQKDSAVRQLTAANATIENLINFKKMDYDTARNEYNDKFNQKVSLYNIAKGVVDAEMSDEERSEERSRANLDIIYQTMSEGKISAETITPEMKYQIGQMELQAGLPTGFYNNLLQSNPDGEILSTTTRTYNGGKYADVLFKQPDGSIKSKSIYLGGASSGEGGSDAKLTEAELERSARSEMAQLLQQKVGEDGKVSPNDYQYARRVWVNRGLESAAFDKAFYNDYAKGATSDISAYNIDENVMNPPSFY